MSRDYVARPSVMSALAAAGEADARELAARAALLGVYVAVARMPDCSSLGAAMAGMLGSGACQSIDDLARLPREQESYRPTMSRECANALHRGWKRAVRRALAGCGGAAGM